MLNEDGYRPDSPDVLYHALFAPRPGEPGFEKFVSVQVDLIVSSNPRIDQIPTDSGILLIERENEENAVLVRFDEPFSSRRVREWVTGLA